MDTLHDEDDPHVEWKIRAAAVPLALVLAVLFHAWSTGHFVQRTWLSMPMHELGHASAGWWSGFAAMPTLWKTLIPTERSWFVTLVLASIIAVVGWRAHVAQRRWLVGLAIGALVLQGIATFATTSWRAQEVITFAGDAGAMILGTLLMLTMFVGPESRLRTNQLRWGFLVIGAAAYVDTFATWWRARSDIDVIPFGEIEGVGKSDPSKLVEVFGWTPGHMIDRYVLVGVTCLIVLTGVWAVGTWRMRALALQRG